MASESRTTTDHTTIKKWVESRGGNPASIKSTIKDGDAGLLRINFPGYSGEDSLVEISWDEFFAKFDEKNLAFLYQDHTSSGEESRFFKLISRDSAEHNAGSQSHNHAMDEKAHASKMEHKAEHKVDEKVHASKTGHKTEEKAHASKTDHKTEEKASVHKATHK